MKVIYIAHPIGGDVPKNLKRIEAIVRHLNLTNPEIIPFAPYWMDCIALDDSIKEERERGVKNSEAWIKEKRVDEVWLYGDRISNGMYGEVLWAHHLNIPVHPMTEGTKRDYQELLKVYTPA